MENYVSFIPIYAIMCCIFLYLDYHANSKIVLLVSKCIPLLMLMVTVGSYLIGFRAPPSSQAAGSSSDLSQLFWGLFFSFLGDAYLVYPAVFLFGVASFAISQSIYISLFAGGFSFFENMSNFEMVIGFAVVCFSCLVYVSIVKYMKPLLAVIAALYCVLISTMLWSALLKMLRNPSEKSFMGATGAGLFYLSDLTLSVNKWGKKIPYAQVLIMSTYYTAQLLITASVV